MEILIIIRQSGTIVLSLMAVLQVVISIIFYWRSRTVKLINWLPKFIMGIVNLDLVMWSASYITSVFLNVYVPPTVRYVMEIIGIIAGPTIMGLLIRFERVQVQLRAQEENTVKIL